MQTRIIFVCLGNICRSPAAEGVMQNKIDAAGLQDRIKLDSAGTIAYHAGDRADSRMRSTAKRRGYNLTSISRCLTQEDLGTFDYIVTMDDSNYDDTASLIERHGQTGELVKFTDFCRHHTVCEVPDPYYGGDDGFERVLDILEDGCDGLLDKVRELH
jgi:protein-tyrosine phosphatase